MLPPPLPHALIPASSSERCQPTCNLNSTPKALPWEQGACALAIAQSRFTAKKVMNADVMP